MAQRKYNSRKRIGGHNYRHSYQVIHLRGANGGNLCPSSSTTYGDGRGATVQCLWCTWLADAGTPELERAA